MTHLAQDLRFAVRQLRKSPGFTVITILMLAVGIGANAALFSVVDALLIRPLPYPHSERLAVLWSVPPRGGISNVSPANFLDFRAQNRVFDRMGAVTPAEFNVVVGGVAERLTGFRASAGFLETLGARPALGRSFQPSDELPGSPSVAILGHGTWQQRFGGDPRIVGQTITVNGRTSTVVGVMPANFRFVFAPEFWMPLEMNAAAAPRDFHVLSPLVRLKPGVSLEQARSAMRTIAAGLAAAHPAALKGWSADLWDWRENIVGGDRQSVLVLFGAVGFLLLIVCVNLANLMMTRAAGRERELALRAALGARRGRIITQLFTESLLISLLGGAAGILLAWWLSRVAAVLVSEPISEGLARIGVDWRVAGFGLILSLVTGVMFGLAPGWRALRLDLNRSLKQAEGTLSPRASRFGGVLVAAQVAIAFMLLAGGGLMVRSLTAMYSADPGFHFRNVLAARVTFPEAVATSPAQVRSFQRGLLERLRSLPGVDSAAFGFALPLEGLAVPMRFQIAGRPAPPSERPSVAFNYVSDGYFETLGVALRRGRLFTSSDDEGAQRVAIVSEAFAKRHFPRQDALGERLLLDERWVSGGRKGSAEPAAYEIVGVVGNVKLWGPHRQGAPQLYVPALQWPQPALTLAVRSNLDAVSVAAAVRGAVHAVDRDIPVAEVRTMEQIAATSFAQPRHRAWIAGSFALAGLVLAALGLCGVLSRAVAQRTHEIGVRMAVGAAPIQVLAMVLRRGVLLAAIGLGVGLAGSVALVRVLHGLLFGVEAGDPVTFLTAAFLLLLVAGAATFLPARRAAAVNPVVALRCE